LLKLFSKVEAKIYITTYIIYIILGSFSSLLMLFFIQKSLPINQQEAKNYQKFILATKQEIFNLERAILKSKHHTDSIENTNLYSHLESISEASRNLTQIPSFIDHKGQLILQRQLGLATAIWDSKIKPLENVPDSHDILYRSFIQEELAFTRQIEEIEKVYEMQYNKATNRVVIYRLLTGSLFLSIVSFIVYKIIDNLIKTNQKIIKILEKFTEELETKVEQRTAQLEESIQTTEAALAQAQNANQAKSRFLANMSHELRTPLNAILGFTQLMCRDLSLKPDHQENLRIINRSGEHLLKLINDILEMSKIEVGQITLNENTFDLYLMLKSLEEMLQLKAKAKNLNLTFNIESDVPRHIHADEGKLRQIIINLLGNALKFTQEGSITLTVQVKNQAKQQEDSIDLLFSDTCSLYFSVEDTGPGIEAEEMNQLFSPFGQTKTGRQSKEGTGLGLSICQKFVDLMGGKLQVESALNKGSLFFFKILIVAKKVTTIEHKSDRETRKIVGLAPKQPQYRILAVDDVPASRLLLKKMLSSWGFEVEEAENGQEAINMWSSWHPHLILMDMRMPIMDGYEATRRIKSQPQGKKPVIIALTASAFEEERVVILSAGCDDFMRKPFYETELLEKMGQHLGINYLYEDEISPRQKNESINQELTKESLAVMPPKWLTQLHEAATRVDNHEIFQLLSEIPDEYDSLAKDIKALVEHFRCDKIIDLTESVRT